MRTFSVTVPAEVGELAALRRGLRRRLEEWRVAGHEADAVVLAAHEAAANAITHASSSVTVRGALEDDGLLTVEVIDAGRWSERSPNRNGGRGLVLIRRLIDDVEIETTQSGTRVTMRQRLDVEGDGASRGTPRVLSGRVS